MKTATKPAQPIEKSSAGASLLAHVIVSKVADHLPVHRQAKMMARFGVEIPDQTMCGWMRQSADLLSPLYDRLKNFVFASKVVGTDDTPVKVLDRELPHTRKGRMWPYVGDRQHPAVVFDYTPTRERAGPEEFLENCRGYLQADAYVAYDSFFTDPGRGLVEVGCMAHARRHIYQARETDPARMGAVLAYIAQLYAVEKRARQGGIHGNDLRLLREQGARPVIEQLHIYLLPISQQLLPKSDAGQAVAYLLKNWAALTRYLEDGDLPIDNNLVIAARGNYRIMPTPGLCRVEMVFARFLYFHAGCRGIRGIVLVRRAKARLRRTMTERTMKDRNAASGFDDYIEPLLEHLRSAGYAERTLIKKRTVARAFGRWSKRKLITPAELNDCHVRAFVGRSPESDLTRQKAEAAFMGLLLEYLRSIAVLRPKRPEQSVSPAESLLLNYQTYLFKDCGLTKTRG